MKNDGEIAFPIPSYTNEYGVVLPPSFGMFLRDWFAGQAPVGFCVLQDGAVVLNVPKTASDAYALADAMLAERENTTKGGA